MPDPSADPSPEPRPSTDLAAGGTGLAPNVAGALSYLVGVISGILFLLLDRDRPYVRFHASQSIVFNLAWIGVWIAVMVLDALLGVIPVLGWLLGVALTLGVTLAGFALWIALMYRAWQGEEWELPVVGPYARKLAREAVA